LDVHRDFCEVAIADAGVVRLAGRVQSEPAALALFAQSLGGDDEVALEATGNALEIARIIEPHVGRVVLANPKARGSRARAPTRSTRVRSRSCSPAVFCRRCGCRMSRRGSWSLRVFLCIGGWLAVVGDAASEVDA
jgi:hypothetical protein